MARMSANDLIHHPLSGFGRGVMHLVVQRAADHRKARRHRHSLATLQRLEDWQIDDFGFTRGEIDQAMDLPLGTNAARWMSAHAARRRADEAAALWERQASHRLHGNV